MVLLIIISMINCGHFINVNGLLPYAEMITDNDENINEETRSNIEIVDVNDENVSDDIDDVQLAGITDDQIDDLIDDLCSNSEFVYIMTKIIDVLKKYYCGYQPSINTITQIKNKIEEIFNNTSLSIVNMINRTIENISNIRHTPDIQNVNGRIHTIITNTEQNISSMVSNMNAEIRVLLDSYRHNHNHGTTNHIIINHTIINHLISEIDQVLNRGDIDDD